MARSGTARTLIKCENIPKSCKLVVNAEIGIPHVAPFKILFSTKHVEVRQVLKLWIEISTSFKKHRNLTWATLDMLALTFQE